MKNNLIIIVLTLFLFSCRSRPTTLSGHEGKPMPSFNLLLNDSTTRLSSVNLPSGKPIVFFYFEPNCPYCRAEMQDIVENEKNLKDIQIVLLTTSAYPLLKEFYDHYELNKYPNITAGLDYDFFFGQYFKTNTVPYLALYDKQRKLKQVHIGRLPTSEMKNILLTN